MSLTDLFKFKSKEPEKVIIDPARQNPHNAAKKLIEQMEEQLPDHMTLSVNERALAMARLVV